MNASTKLYVKIWAALMALLTLTWGAAQLNLGSFNFPVAMMISIAKTLLVIWFFMHVRQTSKLTWLFVAAGFFWLAILFTLTFGDYLTRGWH
ncbi:MAG: cytochrome C oxidase subunit IV family protein [Verrucomicrobiota bacterium]